MDLYSDHPWMQAQWKDGPVPKMTVQGYQKTVLSHSLRKDVRIIGPGQPELAGANHVMAQHPLLVSQIHPEHLIQKEAHNRSDGGQLG